MAPRYGIPEKLNLRSRSGQHVDAIAKQQKVDPQKLGPPFSIRALSLVGLKCRGSSALPPPFGNQERVQRGCPGCICT